MRFNLIEEDNILRGEELKQTRIEKILFRIIYSIKI
jgi:hypothetical protein